jgi:hypothetical protein
MDPRRVLMLAKSKQMLVWNELWAITRKGGSTAGEVVGDAISRVMEAVAGALWPPPEEATPLGRARAFARTLRRGVEQVETTIAPADA